MSKNVGFPTSHTSVSLAEILAAWQGQADDQRNPELAFSLQLCRQELWPRFYEYYLQLQALPRWLRRAIKHRVRLSLAGIALMLALGQEPLFAATIDVDGSACTLADAITAANTDTIVGGCNMGHGADTLNITDDITLFSALPDIESEITINASGHTLQRDAGAPQFRVLNVVAPGDLTFNNATISGGSLNSDVGGSGGGIQNDGGMLTLVNSTVSGNYTYDGGGGVYSSEGTVEIIGSTVSENTGDYDGGGILIFDGKLTLANSTVSGNSAGFGTGGGLINFDGVVDIADSTVSNNGCDYGGGGIANFGDMTITNSTISGNYGYDGAGVYVLETMTISDSTISGNMAGGAGVVAGGVSVGTATLTLNHSIISGNTTYESLNTAEEVYVSTNSGAIIADNHNLIGHNGLSNDQAFQNFTPGPSDISATLDGTQPTALGNILDITLKNNGGPTQTHALVAGSPAIDAVLQDCPPPDTDQRGVKRPQGTACDIGAFEFKETVSPEKPDLVLEKLDHPDPVKVDEPLTYTLIVRNAGIKTARRVRVLDTLPRSVRLLSLPETCKTRRNRVICALGSLDSGAEHNLDIVVKPIKKGKIVNRARVRFKGKDANPRDNRVKQVTTVTHR